MKQTKPRAAGFVPRSLGIAAPTGTNVHEVYLRVASRPSILGKISSIFGSKDIDILGVHGQVTDDGNFADLIFYVEMGGSTATIAAVVDELRRQEFAVSVSSHPRNTIYFEGSSFPLTSGGHYRVFALGANAWASLITALLQEFGSGGSVILREEGTAFGREVVRSIARRFASPDSSILMDNLKALFRASGLGLLEMTDADRTKRFVVTIKEPAVSAEGDEATTDDFLVGVVKGAVGEIYSKDYKVRDESYEDKTITFELVGNKAPLKR